MLSLHLVLLAPINLCSLLIILCLAFSSCIRVFYSILFTYLYAAPLAVKTNQSAISPNLASTVLAPMLLYRRPWSVL